MDMFVLLICSPFGLWMDEVDGLWLLTSCTLYVYPVKRCCTMRHVCEGMHARGGEVESSSVYLTRSSDAPFALCAGAWQFCLVFHVVDSCIGSSCLFEISAQRQ